MQFIATPIDGLWEIATEKRSDARGSLTRLFCAEEFAVIRPDLRFVQTNLTLTHKAGSVRGLHFQRPPALEAKLVRCLQGAVHDVVVDLRAGSASFGRWHAVQLSACNERQLLIPEGCAHGFQSLCDEVQMLYQHSAFYAPGLEDVLRFDDARLAIDWPLPIGPVSERDLAARGLSDDFEALQA